LEVGEVRGVLWVDPCGIGVVYLYLLIFVLSLFL